MQESALHRDADFANVVAHQAAVKAHCNWRGHEQRNYATPAAAASRPHAAESTQKSLATAPPDPMHHGSKFKKRRP